MTSGASAANSAACLRVSAALPALHRSSIRTFLRPMGSTLIALALAETLRGGLPSRIARRLA